jgi:hypothetical protein
MEDFRCVGGFPTNHRPDFPFCCLARCAKDKKTAVSAVPKTLCRLKIARKLLANGKWKLNFGIHSIRPIRRLKSCVVK